MQRTFLAIVLLCVLFSAGCSPGSKNTGTAVPNSASNTEPTEASTVASAIIDWANVIKFNGIQYLDTYDDVGRSLKKEDLGPKFAEVRFQLNGNVEDPNYRIKNGDAAFYPAGTPATP